MEQMYKDSGETLIDTLHSLYETHGYHQEKLISIELDPETGTNEVNKLMNQFMNPTEEIIANLNILSVENYLTGEKIISNGESVRSEEHTSELQSRGHLVCRLMLEKKKKLP